MRLLFSLLAICSAVALPIHADGVSAAPALEQRPPGALDSVVLISGELVRGVVRASPRGVTVTLPSGGEREIASGEIRRINRWEPGPPTLALSASAASATAPVATTASTGPSAPIEPTEPIGRHWYGLQNVGVDLLAVSLGISAIALGDHSLTALETLGYASLGVYALGSPIIHAFHHDSPATSFASFGLRVGVPLAFGLITYAVSQPSVSSCEALPGNQQPELGCGLGQGLAVVFFAGVGMVTAMIIDDAALAHETVQPEPPRISLAPLLLPRGSPLAAQRGTGLELAARF